MIMPVIFLEFLKIVEPKKIFTVMNWLFSANLAIFLILLLINAAPSFYLYSLAFHHLYILILIFYLIAEYCVNLLRNRTKYKIPAPFGTVLFFICIVLSILSFLMQKTQIYSIVVSTGFVALVLSVSKLILGKTVHSYEEQIQAEIYKKMAYTDALTGLNNRNAFIDCQQSMSEADNLCYIAFDINNLKKINDKNGHNAGDAVICKAADIIKDCFALLGKCYRIGGDEFAVICTDKDEAQIKAALEKIEKSSEKYNLDSEIKLSVAYGYSFRETPDMSAEEIFNKADKAMYMRKKSEKLDMLS